MSELIEHARCAAVSRFGVMRQLLPENQEKRGAERGSWDPAGDRWGSAGGRLYVTCLSLYVLEVYYRHLPIYRDGLLAE